MNLINSSDTFFVSEIVYGNLVQERVPPDEFPLIPEIFDSIKKWIGIKTKTEEVATVQKNAIPQPPKHPAKKEEPLTAVLPEGLKRKSENISEQ